MRFDIDHFCFSSSIAVFKTINTKQRPLQKTQILLFIIHAFCSQGIPLKFSHDGKHDDKI